VSSDLALPGQVVLLAVFNALYVLPLAAILVTHSLFGERAETFLTRARETIERLSPGSADGAHARGRGCLVVHGANGLAGS
jgi:hypothetical protein